MKLIKFGLSFVVIIVGALLFASNVWLVPVLIGIPGTAIGLGLMGVGLKWLFFH
jgi:hypothetical protein